MTGSKFARTMAAGLLIGICAGILADPLSNRQKSKIKRKTQGFFKSVGSMIDTAMDVIR